MTAYEQRLDEALAVSPRPPIELVLSRLRGRKQVGPRAWMAVSPNRHDGLGGLLVSEESGGSVVVYDFAQSSLQHILSELGLSFHDLFPLAVKPCSQHEYRRRVLISAKGQAEILLELWRGVGVGDDDLVLFGSVEVALPRIVEELRELNRHDDDVAVLPLPEPTFDNELPGRLGDLQLAVMRRMRKPSAISAAATVLSVVGHLYGRRWLGPTGLGMNSMFVLTAETGRGKDTLIDVPSWLLAPLGDAMAASISGQFASRPALYERLMEVPSTLSVVDEVGHMLKAISNQRDSHMHDLGGFLMELFSAARKIIHPRGRRQQKGVVDMRPVHCPHFSLLGATTSAMLNQAFSVDMTAAGQLNRLLIVCLDDWNGVRQIPEYDSAPPTWWAGWAAEQLARGGAGPESRFADSGSLAERIPRLTWSDELNQFYWDEDARRDDLLEQEPQLVRELRRRDLEHALKVAQVLALADDRDELTKSDFEWALAFVDRLQWSVLELCRREGILAGNTLDAVAAAAVDTLRRYGPKSETRLSADCRRFGATKGSDRSLVLRLMAQSYGVRTMDTGRTIKLFLPE
jgi:hypothetical protein